MLDGIRKASKNWLGRAVLTVVMGILVVSFAIWGIGDMLRVGGGSAVARIGDVDINVETVRTAYTTALEETSQRMRRRLTNDQARALGLDRQVLARLVADAALDQRVHALGLSLSEDEVARLTMAEPNFQSGGQFDRTKFYEALRRANMTEATFFKEQRKVLLRRELLAGIAAEITAPQNMVEAAYDYFIEQRTVKYFTLPDSAAGTLPTPDDATLKSFYEAHKTEFVAPEYRKVNILAAIPKELGIDMTITDTDLRRAYDRLSAAGALGEPEKREALQLLFPTEKEAAEAAAKLKTGTRFEALLDERKIKPSDANLGARTESGFANPEIGKAVFALANGAVSAPIKTEFGTALLKLVAIQPGTIPPFDKAKADLGEQALQEKLRSDPRVSTRLDDIQKKIDDAKVAGKSLAESAPNVGLTLRTIDAVSAAGQDKTGKKVNIPGDADTLKAIFQSDVGLDDEAVRLPQGGLVWFEIGNVESRRDLSFDEAKPEVLIKWRAAETAKSLNAMAADYIKRLDAGEDIAAVAKAAKVPVAELSVLRANGGAIGTTGAAQTFATPVGKAATAGTGNGRIVLKVISSQITPFDNNNDVVQQIRRTFNAQLSDDVISQYIQKLQAEYGLRINETLLRQVTGGAG